jgi:hypothetical protein
VLRRGQESNLPRLLRTDNGFEDREDHQAPFTLREEEKENAQLPTSGIQRPIAEEEKDDRLFNFFKRADDGVEVGPIAGVEFGMEQFAIGANFESATARRNERERFDAFAEFKNFGRQTDGLRRVVSNDAIFDRDFGLHPASSFPGENGTEVERAGQGASRTGILAEAGAWHEAPLELARLTDCEWKPALRRLLLQPQPVHRRRSNRKRQQTIASPAIYDSRRTTARYRNAYFDLVARPQSVR